MIRRMLITGALMAAVAVPALASDSLSELDIEEFIMDKTMNFNGKNGTGKITYTGGNEVIIEKHDGSSETGFWSVEDGKVCTQLESNDMATSCFNISRSSAEDAEVPIFRTSDGSTMYETN